jgi:hypothetical protein
MVQLLLLPGQSGSPGRPWIIGQPYMDGSRTAAGSDATTVTRTRSPAFGDTGSVVSLTVTSTVKGNEPAGAGQPVGDVLWHSAYPSMPSIEVVELGAAAARVATG